jgi:hypothetical protein
MFHCLFIDLKIPLVSLCLFSHPILFNSLIFYSIPLYPIAFYSMLLHSIVSFTYVNITAQSVHPCTCKQIQALFLQADTSHYFYMDYLDIYSFDKSLLCTSMDIYIWLPSLLPARKLHHFDIRMGNSLRLLEREISYVKYLSILLYLALVVGAGTTLVVIVSACSLCVFGDSC